MSRKQKLATAVVLVVGLVFAPAWYLRGINIPILQPHGIIADKERHLIIVAVLLSLVVVIPVYAMLIGFAWKYRESNKKSHYEPDFDHSRVLESIWWGVPLALILILGVITWRSSQELDPFRPISASPAMNIQVVSLQWKWLFIYPQQNLATVNYVQFPVNTPIRFEITSDAPMNSFWIPQLGGQIYAMSGMATHLNLEANQAGSYKGVSANISGDGFAGMRFTAKASSETDFNNWVKSTHNNKTVLDTTAYSKLSSPSQNNPVRYFGSTQNGMFDSVVAKYQAPVYFNQDGDER